MQGYIEYSYAEFEISLDEAESRAADDPFMEQVLTIVDYLDWFTIPSWIPLIGGHWGLSDLKIDSELNFDSRSGEGRSIMDVSWTGFDLGWFQMPQDFWGVDVWTELAAEGLYLPFNDELVMEQATYFVDTLVENVPIWGISWGITVKGVELTVRLAVVGDFGLTISITEKRNPSTGEFNFDSAEIFHWSNGIGSASLDVGVANLEISLGNRVGVGLALDASGDISLNRAEVGVIVRFDWSALWYSDHWGRVWVYDFWSGNTYEMPASKPEGWRVMDRDYINEDYAKFVANLGIGHSSPTTETMLIQNVFPRADPSLAADKSDNLMAVYVHDDPSKTLPQSFEIYYTMWDGYQWTTPKPITDNYVTDVKPAVIYDPNGNAIAAWTTINNETLPANITDFNEIVRYGEIAYSIFNPSTKTWTTPQLLTNNAVFDYAPTLAADQSGNVMAMWQVDEDNNITIGSHMAAQDYYYSVWDGSSWSTPSLALDDIDIVDNLSFDFDNNKAIATWSQDTDGNSTTQEDIEIFYSTWDGAIWGTPVRFTTDSYPDKLPGVAYAQDGNPLIAWTKDESIISPTENRTIFNIYYSKYNGAWSTPTLLSETGNVEALKLVKDPLNNPVILWQQLSNEGSDIFYSVYDTPYNSWSLKNQLTSDDSAETVFTPVITSQNDIVSTYLKGKVTYQNETFTYLNGTFTTQVPNITSYDMYLLRHPIFKDLEITSQDIVLSKTNPAPGETVKINATIHNIGDLSIDGVKVEFQDGPEGPQIGFTQTIGTINAGETKVVSTDWTVPTTLATHDIYVLVDPINEIPEENETNNIAYITTVLPDLTPDSTLVTYPNDGTSKEIIINATIANKGHVAASNIPVGFYYSEYLSFRENKTFIANQTIDTLNPNSSQTLSLAWNVSSLEPRNYYVFAVVDENNTILEGDETNNIRRALVKAAPDLSINGGSIQLSTNLEGDITVDMTVTNEGYFDAENVTVQAFSSSPYYLNTTTNTLVLNTTAMLFNETISVLPSKSNTTISKIWSAPPGDYRIYVLVDPNASIPETNELNNLAVKPTRILQKLSLASLDAVDTDEDGLFDYISAKVQADIPSDGYYYLTGNLTDDTGTQITTASNLTYLTSGTQNIIINFSGIAIRRHGVDGSYTLKDVKLYDSTSLLGLLLGTHPTPSYTYTEFQTAPATLEDVFSDQGIDLNQNGIYDYLEVEANVNVTKAGNYNVRALLYDSDGNCTTLAQNSTYLNTGIQTVKLRFNGPDIFNHGVDGPYNLAYITLYNADWDETDRREDAYNTSAYAYTQFEGGIFDIATTDVTPSQTVVGRGSTMSINVTVTNQGDYTETFNVTARASTIETTRANKTFGGSGSDYARSVVQTSDGGYALAGYTDSFGPSTDFWLVKTDASGNELWNSTFGGSGGDWAYSVVETGDGGYALAGYTNSFGPSYDVWLVKTNSAGNHVWNRTFGGSGHDLAYCVVQTSDEGYAIAGYSTLSGYYDFWLVKTDANGIEEWNRTFGGSGGDFAYSVVQTSDGGYALAGYTWSFGAGGNDFWLVKTDALGNHLWNRTFGGSGGDVAESVVETSDGGYALAGYTDSFGAGNSDFWLVKTDAAGNHLWNVTYGGSSADYARSVVQTGDGGYALAGYTDSFGAGGQDFWLVKADASGNHLWNSTFGGASSDVAYSVVQTGDGGYALAGYTDSFGAGVYDFWLVKIPAISWYETQTVTNLLSKTSTTLTFLWNTTGVPYGNYTLSAYATPVPTETDTADNTYTAGIILITITGDVNGDRTVETSDLSDLKKAYGSKPGDLNWNSNCDLNSDDKIDASDLFHLSKNYGKTV